MVYNFKFNLTKKDLFLSSIYYTYLSISGIFTIVFSLFSIGLLIYLLINNMFSTLSSNYKFLLIFCCIIFTVIQPILIYIKVLNRFKKFKQNEIELSFFPDKFNIRIGSESGDFEYNRIFKIKKYSTMIVLMYNAINGQIIPNRVFDNNREEFYEFIKEKIKK